MPLIILIGIYLVLGCLWALFNSTSRTHPLITERAEAEEWASIWHFVGVGLAIVVWPLGLAITVLAIVLAPRR